MFRVPYRCDLVWQFLKLSFQNLSGRKEHGEVTYFLEVG